MAEELYDKYYDLVWESTKNENGFGIDLSRFDGICDDPSGCAGCVFTNTSSKLWEGWYNESLSYCNEDDEKCTFEEYLEASGFTEFKDCTEEMYAEALENLIDNGPDITYNFR